MPKETNKTKQKTPHTNKTKQNTLKKSVQIPVGTDVRIGNEANCLTDAG